MPLNKIDISMLEDAGASGQVLTSDGTNWTSADAAAPLPAVGADGNVLTSDGTNWASEESAAVDGDSVFPFYKTDGTSDNITITSGQFPFYKADGTLDNIAAPGGGDGLNIGIPSSSVAGDTLYHDGSVYARLPKGTAAQVLKMNSGATAPEWGEDAGLPATGVDGNVLTSDGTNWASEAAAGGGGVWTQLDRGTTSGNFITEIDITPADFDMVYNTSQGNASDYDGYKLYTTLETENDSVDYAVRIRNSSANTWTTSGYNHTVIGMMNAANYVHTKSLSQQSQIYWKPLGGQVSNNNPKSRAHQEFTMYRSRDENNGFIINCLTSFHQGVSGGECGVFSASLYIDSQSGNGIRLYASSGNIKGAYTFYGIKGS